MLTTKPTCRFTTLFLISLSSTAAHVAYGQSTVDKERESAKQFDHDRRKDEERNEQMRRTVRRALLQAEETSDLLTQSLRLLDTHSARLQALLTNDDGRRIAAADSLALALLPMFETPAGSPGELRARKQTVDDIASSLGRELESHPVGFMPDAKTLDEVSENFQWAKTRLSFLREREASLDSLIERAPKTAPSGSPTLDAHIKSYNAKRLELWAAARALGEAEAKEPAKQVLVESARLAELEKAQAESERLLQEARAQIEKMRLDFELKLKTQAAQNERDKAEADIRYRDTLAELERAKKLADAGRRVEDAKADDKSGKLNDEADKSALRTKCESLEVKTLLAPFLAKGKYQPGFSRQQTAAAPMLPISFSKLATAGCLQQTPGGLQKLLDVGAGKDKVNPPLDTMRPKWGYAKQLHKCTTDDAEALRRAQELLIDLGPTMVELGMLSP